MTHILPNCNSKKDPIEDYNNTWPKDLPLDHKLNETLKIQLDNVDNEHLHAKKSEDEDEEEEEQQEGEDGGDGVHQRHHQVPQGRPVPDVQRCHKYLSWGLKGD